MTYPFETRIARTFEDYAFFLGGLQMEFLSFRQGSFAVLSGSGSHTMGKREREITGESRVILLGFVNYGRNVSNKK